MTICTWRDFWVTPRYLKRWMCSSTATSTWPFWVYVLSILKVFLCCVYESFGAAKCPRLKNRIQSSNRPTSVMHWMLLHNKDIQKHQFRVPTTTNCWIQNGSWVIRLQSASPWYFKHWIMVWYDMFCNLVLCVARHQPSDLFTLF